MKSLLALLLAAAVLGAQSAVRAETPERVDKVVAIVNDSIITRYQVESAMGRLSPTASDEQFIRIFTNALDGLVIQKIIVDEYAAGDAKVPETLISDEVENRIKSREPNRVELLRRLKAQGTTFESYRKLVRDEIIAEIMTDHYVPRPVISPQKIEDYYVAHRDDYKLGDRVNYRTIWVYPSATSTNAAGRAKDILTLIKNGAPFPELARAYSEGTQRDQGGLTGWQDLANVNEELRPAVEKLKVGEVSDVIRTSSGNCCIVRLEERSPAHIKPLGEVRGDIERTLDIAEHNRLLDAWVARLKAKWFIRYFSINNLY